jgi:glyoxylase-like metal-dependent hydrolase (beta-lactamase superfamily II)
MSSPGISDAIRVAKRGVFCHSETLNCHSARLKLVSSDRPPKGLLMFDTGLSKNIDAQFGNIPALLKPLFHCEVIEPVSTLVDTESFCPGRKSEVILSHPHWDHASGIEDLEDRTPVWVAETEFANGHRFENFKLYI